MERRSHIVISINNHHGFYLMHSPISITRDILRKRTIELIKEKYGETELINFNHDRKDTNK